MGRSFPVAVVVVAVLLTLLSTTTFTAAKEITVGGDLGWTVPQSKTEYANWASSQTFHVGDVLVFNFDKSHTVGVVWKDAFETCNIDEALALTEGPVKITLEEEGEKFFICTTPEHCNNGQKVAIMVTPLGGAVPPSSDTAVPPSSDDHEAVTPVVSPSPSPLESAAPAPSPLQNKNGSPAGLGFQSFVLTLLTGFLAVALMMF